MTTKKCASVYLANLPITQESSNREMFTIWIQALKKINNKIFSTIERGDFLENVCESGYRANGVYMFDIVDNDLVIRELSRWPDDYGTIPSDFELITQFKDPTYWFDDDKCYSGDIYSFTHHDVPKSYFHNNIVFIPLLKLIGHISFVSADDIDLYKVVKKNTIKITYDGNIYFVTDKSFYKYSSAVLTGKTKKYAELLRYITYVSISSITWIQA